MRSDAKETKSQNTVYKRCSLSQTALKQHVPKVMGYAEMASD